MTLVSDSTNFGLKNKILEHIQKFGLNDVHLRRANTDNTLIQKSGCNKCHLRKSECRYTHAHTYKEK